MKKAIMCVTLWIMCGVIGLTVSAYFKPQLRVTVELVLFASVIGPASLFAAGKILLFDTIDYKKCIANCQ